MNKLEELLQIIRHKHVFIQMHNYPDQDALASAKGLQVLMGSRGIPSTICYTGRIDKASTLQMIELLHIDVHKIDEITMTEEDEIIIVDGQKGNTNMEDFIGDEIACIDHHPPKDLTQYRFSDVRDDYGACATIISEYLQENQVEISTELATALLYGIKIDTNNLTRGVSDADIDAYCMLYKLADIKILRDLEQSSLELRDLIAYKQALSDFRVAGHVGYANIGKDCSEALIGSVSDFLMNLKEVDFTVIHSFRAGGVKFSTRSKQEVLDCSTIIRTALKGYGDGGGHAEMAAGFIPSVDNEEDADRLAKIIEERVAKLCQDKVSSAEA